MGIYFVHSLVKGKDASENPWGSSTLEWQTASPPIQQNFVTIPVVDGGPYDYAKRAKKNG